MNFLGNLKQNESIQKAFSLIPKEFHRLLQCDWLIGADPVAKQLHPFTSASYGRSYANTAHVAYPKHQLTLPEVQRATTVVLPIYVTPEVVVHELGHVLHEKFDFIEGFYPCTWYAKTDVYETFAEAFTAYCVAGYSDLLHTDDYAWFHTMRGILT